MFTNLILGLALSSSIGLADMNHDYLLKNIPFERQMHSYVVDTSFAMTIQNINLVHIDIFDFTKTGYSTTNYTYSNGEKYTWTYGEANPIAKLFFDKNLWNVGFGLALSANLLIIPLCDSIENNTPLKNTGILKNFVNSVVSISEILAISTWIGNSYCPVLKSMNIHATIVCLNF